MNLEEKILCLMCENAYFLSRGKLLEHISEHLGYKRHICSTCNYASSSQEDMLRHGDDDRHITKIFGFRQEYLERVSEIVYKDCVDAHKRGKDAMLKCTVVRCNDENVQRYRTEALAVSSSAADEAQMTQPDSTAEEPVSMPSEATSKKSKREKRKDKPSSSSKATANDEELPSRICKKCKAEVDGSLDQLRRHACSHLRNVSWRCTYCSFRTSVHFDRLEKHFGQKHADRQALDIYDCVEKDELENALHKYFPSKSRQKRPQPESDESDDDSSPEVAAVPVRSPAVIATSSIDLRVPQSPNVVARVDRPPISSTLCDSVSVDESGSTNAPAAHKIFCNECGASVSSLFGAKRSHVAIKHLGCDSATEVEDTDSTFIRMLATCFPGTRSLTDLQCLQCGKEYTSEGGRQGHVARKHFIRTLQCPFASCRFKATYTDDVSRHIKTEHNARGKDQMPREVSLRWEWERKAFQANLLPHVHTCFPQPLPEKDRRRQGSPTPADLSSSDNALALLMSDVRQSLRDDSPPPSCSSARRHRYRSESAAQSASITSAPTTVISATPSSTNIMQRISNVVSSEADELEAPKPTPFLTISSDVANNADGICVTKEKVKRRRQMSISDLDHSDRAAVPEEPASKRPPLLRSFTPRPALLGDFPEDQTFRPIVVDTSKPPPDWQSRSALSHRPIPSPTEPKFGRPQSAYSPHSRYAASHQSNDVRTRTRDTSRPAPVFGSFPHKRQPLEDEEYRHRSISRGSSVRGGGRSRSSVDRQRDFDRSSDRHPHDVGRHNDDHRWQNQQFSGSKKALECRSCKRSIPGGEVERHVWTAHVDVNLYAYSCLFCDHKGRTFNDILKHATKTHKYANKTSVLLVATRMQKEKFDAQKKHCFASLDKR